MVTQQKKPSITSLFHQSSVSQIRLALIFRCWSRGISSTAGTYSTRHFHKLFYFADFSANHLLLLLLITFSTSVLPMRWLSLYSEGPQNNVKRRTRVNATVCHTLALPYSVKTGRRCWANITNRPTAECRDTESHQARERKRARFQPLWQLSLYLSFFCCCCRWYSQVEHVLRRTVEFFLEKIDVWAPILFWVFLT